MTAIIIMGGGIGLYYYETHYITATLTKYEQTETTGMQNRTACGWYQLYSYYLQPDTPLPSDRLYLVDADEDGYEYRLALLEFNLKEYAAQKLDAAAKKNIRTVLENFSKTKMKVIVRFLYDWDGMGIQSEPDDMKWIKKHMTQTAQLLNQYADIIYTTQGIFVGSWAEMHDSNYLSAPHMTSLLLHFASVTDASIYLAVRTPEQYRSIMNEYETHMERYQKYDITMEELKKRLGLFNDGMLGSVSDIGTYHKADIAPSEEEKLAIRNSELTFQGTLALQVPNGGEVVNDNPFNNGASAIKDLSAMHISYLNQMYDDAVIHKWKKTVYSDKTGIYHGASVYDYITDHLGARFVLRDCSLSYRPMQRNDALGSITLENVGFSNLYHTTDFTLSLKSKSGKKEKILLSSDTDTKSNPCRWNAGQKYTLSFSFSPFDLEEGIYYLTAALTDPVAKETISFANDSFDDDLQGYCLGTIQIQKGRLQHMNQ